MIGLEWWMEIREKMLWRAIMGIVFLVNLVGLGT